MNEIHLKPAAIAGRARLLSLRLCANLVSRRPRLADERGQGTVEYVGLLLLVAVLMGGMVAAVGGLNSLPGKELAEAITKKIVQAVQKVAFAK